MFGLLRKEDAQVSKTGIFIVDGQKLITLDEMPPANTINSVIEALGYEASQLHMVLTVNSNKTTFMFVRRHSKNPVFVMAKSKDIALSYSDLANEIRMVDWDFERRQQLFEDQN